MLFVVDRGALSSGERHRLRQRTIHADPPSVAGGGARQGPSHVGMPDSTSLWATESGIGQTTGMRKPTPIASGSHPSSSTRNLTQSTRRSPAPSPGFGTTSLRTGSLSKLGLPNIAVWGPTRVDDHQSGLGQSRGMRPSEQHTGAILTPPFLRDRGFLRDWEMAQCRTPAQQSPAVWRCSGCGTPVHPPDEGAPAAWCSNCNRITGAIRARDHQDRQRASGRGHLRGLRSGGARARFDGDRRRSPRVGCAGDPHWSSHLRLVGDDTSPPMTRCTR